MTMTERARIDRTPKTAWWHGLAVGVLIGAAIWVIYFVQASTLDRFSWETVVVPTLGAVAAGAAVVAVLRPSARRTSLGIAVGILLTLPMVLGAFLVVFTVLNLE
jgi:hypothetical protein